ncbi:DUF6301 family protein [Nocardia brasiliensis]|uniref:DUF6301 family protein n=1 Tax=Nocardia brasiliensis TaxID=37326 RepID=UPI00245376CE|nr:DUF6301 family protein [Nocardia brasiliensis]
MTEWRALTDEEIVDLATRLRSVQWSWRVADAAELAAEFGWKVVLAKPEWAMLDTGFGMGSGRIAGSDGAAEYITAKVAGPAPDDAAGHAQSRDAFARMGAALTGALGAPTDRKPGASAEIRWAGTETTVALKDVETAVQLSLIDNAKLALRDQAVELEGQEL